ncbi:MAG TPA: iron-containing alcohol dehydrogenase [Methylomirabilota bacterium]|nr:iron-containing alcohol dehydrogenase [Methylomirabilota bacterium]
MRFEFATAGRILFGPGTLKELPALARTYGTRALVVTGSNPDRAETLRRMMADQGITCRTCPIAGEPTLEAVERGAETARQEGIEFVLGFGGGSALDAAKAVAALATNAGPALDYLEIIGRGRPLTKPPLPFLAVPTTAGTGAEVTRNAVIASPVHRVKASLRSPLLLARVAVVDPELTRDLPPALTAATGLDALTQLIEPYVSPRAHPLTDGFCVEGLPRVARSLRRVWEAPGDAAAREDMALASLLSGLALANAGLGAVHGFAAPVGGRFAAPHGAVCAALLPHAMEVNLQALRSRQPESPALKRFEHIACLLTGRSGAVAEEGVAWVREVTAHLQIPSLRSYGVTEADFVPLAEAAAQASSMKGNPVELTTAERIEILRRASR